MKRTISHFFFLVVVFFGATPISYSQTVFWIEDFDDGGGGRWTTENAPGSMTNPTPAGIVGLSYGVNAAIEHDYFVINDRNTPELSGDITVGLGINAQGQFVQGHHYDCAAPNNLPNPFVNGVQPGPNQSLHITAFPSCATLLYGGTPGSDDWNCIAIDGNDWPITQSEQTAWLNNNINASGKCNLKLTADFFLGGDAQGVKDHTTILYSTDAGVTWKILQDNLASCVFFLAGTCNAWHRMSFDLPADADNQNDLRIAFRWVEDGNLNNMTDDYALGASFNVDNIMISGCSAPSFDFSADLLNPCKNQTVTFTSSVVSNAGYYVNCLTFLTDDCQPSLFSWSITGPGVVTYVGGTNANSPNPQVQFSTVGNYSAVLTLTNCAGNSIVSKPNYITVISCPPLANFMTSQVVACAIPASKQDTVIFTDLSVSIPGPILTWTWAFLPNTVTYRNATNANSQNPQVTFDAVGVYQVTLTVTNMDGSDAEIKGAYINAIDCNCGGGVAPSVFWTETFTNGCASGCLAQSYTTGPNGAWTITTWSPNEGCGVASDPNVWYVSGKECGNAAGACGTVCVPANADPSLHLGSTSMGDLGAAYDVGGWCPLFGSPGTQTDTRVETPTINCTGRTGITLAFNYIMTGELSVDYCYIQYSTNNGGTWTNLSFPAQTNNTGCGGQGRWTAYSIPLAASCDNNANVKIGFRWVNDDNGSGSDPSFALDDITLTGTGAAPVNTWEGDVSNNWATAGNWSTGVVPTAATDCQVPATVCPTCVMPVISAAANARNLCNYGLITLSGNNTLTIAVNLLNEGAITSNTTVNTADLIFATSPSLYRGSGTLFDVDVGVTSSNLTLEANMTARSMIISTAGTVSLATYTLSLCKNLTKTAGTFTASNGIIRFINACPTCLDQTNIADVAINANQAFGDVYVNKTAGIKTSLISNFSYTFAAGKTLTIQSGILDANDKTLSGAGNLTMTGGELQLAKNAIALPELTGTYTLTGGRITLDGTNQIIKSRSAINANYYELQFAGTGIKTFSGGNVHVGKVLYLSLPTTTGNYVNAGVDTLKVLSTVAGSVVRTGGHVVGCLMRNILSGTTYVFDVGSNYSDLETFFEPLTFIGTSLTNVSSITGRFYDIAPNPNTVSLPFTNGAGNPDTISALELEGYWSLRPDKAPTGGSYQVMVSPSNYWTFAATFGGGRYALLKQINTGNPWGFVNNGVRVNDSTTKGFTNFSNYALGYADSIIPPLPVELIDFSGYCEDNHGELSWITASEFNVERFNIEKSIDGIEFQTIGSVPGQRISNELILYRFTDDEEMDGDGVYYRLSEKDIDGKIYILKTIFVSCNKMNPDLLVKIYPNPTQDKVYTIISTLIEGYAEFIVTNLVGERVFSSEKVLLNRGQNLHAWDFPAILESGVYLIRITVDGSEFSQKLIIIRS